MQGFNNSNAEEGDRKQLKRILNQLKLVLLVKNAINGIMEQRKYVKDCQNMAKLQRLTINMEEVEMLIGEEYLIIAKLVDGM